MRSKGLIGRVFFCGSDKNILELDKDDGGKTLQVY